MKLQAVALAGLMAPRLGSVDPAEHVDEEFDLYSIPAFDRGTPDVVPGIEIGSSKQIVKSGDVLLSRIVPHIRRAWVVAAQDGRRLIASGEWIVFRNERAHPGYLRHWLLSDQFHAQFMRTVSGVGGSLLRARSSYVGQIQLPLPPLPEQRRIADILDTADALRAKRRETIQQANGLTSALFNDIFGDATTNSRSWPVVRVSDFVAEFQGGRSLESGDEDLSTRNRILKISAVTGNRFRPEESKPIPDSYVPQDFHFVRSGDLLFSRANTSELVGAVAYVDQAPPRMLLPDKLWRFVWKDPCAVSPRFVWALFQTPAFRSAIGSRATGTGGSMKNISQAKVMGISTIWPPVTLQHEFERRLQALEALGSRQTLAADQLDALFASLQHRAFRGEL